MKQEPQVVLHNGHLALCEKKPITLAKIPINGEKIENCLLLHPRYVPKKTEHQIIEVQGYRRGRTLDILLENPIQIKNEQYNIISFKGIGADADKDLKIHPTLWYRGSRWISKRKGDQYGRVWGAIKTASAKKEFNQETLFEEYGIPHTPYISMNHIPEEISRHISKIEGRNQYVQLSQLVRVCKTNLRTIDSYLLTTDIKNERIDPISLAIIDSKIISNQLMLKEMGEMLAIVGRVKENRYVDGRFTDAENYLKGEIDSITAMGFISEVISSSLNLLTCEQLRPYSECMDNENIRNSLLRLTCALKRSEYCYHDSIPLALRDEIRRKLF